MKCSAFNRKIEVDVDSVKKPVAVMQARGTCPENCYANYGYGLEALGCLAGCNRRSLSRSLEYTPAEVVTSAREARDNKDKECADKCAAIYGGSGISTFGCYIDCKERNRGRSLGLEYTQDKVAVIKDPSTSAREARGTQACSENCYAKYGYGLEALGCLAGCNRRSLSRSLEYTPADFTSPLNPFSTPAAQPINSGQLLQSFY
jgi:hypothetical protein